MTNKPKDLKARRQRNLTTSFLSTNQIEKAKLTENCLDEFLNSLEDINNFLEQKLHSAPNSKQINDTTINNNGRLKRENPSTYASKPSRKSRRFFTQPIIFSHQDYMNQAKANE